MTKEEVIEVMKQTKEVVSDYHQKAFDVAIQALEQCEVWNGVHGQVVATKGTFHKILEDEAEQKSCEDCLFKNEWQKIGKLISVVLEKRTEPKTGHWVISHNHGKCSECGASMPKGYFRNFCPKCGIKMEVEE